MQAELDREEAYAGSVRRHCEAKRQEILHELLWHHRAMIEAHTRNLERLIERHREGVEACEVALGLRMQADSETTDQRKAS